MDDGTKQYGRHLRVRGRSDRYKRRSIHVTLRQRPVCNGDAVKRCRCCYLGGIVTAAEQVQPIEAHNYARDTIHRVPLGTVAMTCRWRKVSHVGQPLPSNRADDRRSGCAGPPNARGKAHNASRRHGARAKPLGDDKRGFVWRVDLEGKTNYAVPALWQSSFSSVSASSPPPQRGSHGATKTVDQKCSHCRKRDARPGGNHRTTNLDALTFDRRSSGLFPTEAP